MAGLHTVVGQGRHLSKVSSNSICKRTSFRLFYASLGMDGVVLVSDYKDN